MAEGSILFVDDEPQIRKLITTFLGRRGYEVKTANDGLEALRALEQSTPDLIITDVNMPIINGLELTRRLRASHKTARIPIIMLSAQKETKDVLAGYAEGADEYVPKPVDMAILAVKVETLIRRAAAFAQAEAGPRQGRVVLFFRGKGGVGATTLAVNTAVALATADSKRVALLDLNLEFGNVSIMMDLKPGRTLSELQDVAVADLDTHTFAAFLAEHPSHVQVVVAAEGPEKAELVTITTVQQTIDRLRRQMDYVLVDTTPSFSELNLAVIDVTDIIALITTPHLPALRATYDCVEILSKLEVQESSLLTVLNRSTPTGLEDEQVSRFFRRKPDIVVPYRALFDDAADFGTPMVTAHPADAATRALRELAGKVGSLAVAGV